MADDTVMTAKELRRLWRRKVDPATLEVAARNERIGRRTIALTADVWRRCLR